jgi:hypothetical protein
MKVQLNFPVSMLPGLYDAPRKFARDALAYTFAVYIDRLEGEHQKRLKDAAKHLGIPLNSQSMLQELVFYGNQLKEQHEPPLTSIEVQILLDSIDTYESFIGQDWDLLLLGSYMALRSILGKQAFVRTSNRHMLTRMAGQRRFSEDMAIPDLLRQNLFTPAGEVSRYKMQKLRFELSERFGVKFYSIYIHGFYFSLKAEVQTMADEAVKRAKKNRQKKYRETQREAYENAKRQAC